jgi:hypothetical protein
MGLLGGFQCSGFAVVELGGGFVGFAGVFGGLLGELMGGEVIAFAVGGCGGGVGVGGQVVEFGYAVVSALGHCVLL